MFRQTVIEFSCLRRDLPERIVNEAAGRNIVAISHSFMAPSGVASVILIVEEPV